MNKRAILGEQLHRQFPSCRPHYIPTDLLGMAKNEWRDAWNTANVKTALQTCCCCLLTLPMLNRTQASSTLWTLLLHTEHAMVQRWAQQVFACLASSDSGADQVEQWVLYWISGGPCWDGCQLRVKGPCWKMGNFRKGVCCGVALFSTPSNLLSHLLLRNFPMKKQNHTFIFTVI